MTKYFITGGAGFIGYHLTHQLLASEASQVISYDAFKHHLPLDDNRWFNAQSYRLQKLQSYGGRYISLRGDTTDRGLLKEAIEKYRPEVVIHLAALSIAGVCNTYPEEARINVFESTNTLMEVVRELSYKLDRVVYSSSSMVYGDFLRDKAGAILPAREDQLCTPIDLYGAMKLAGEHIIRVYGRRFGVPYVIVRPSAVYGPTDCNKRVTELFLMNALEGGPLELDSGGSHQLDFTYVEDIARGFVLAATSQKALGETFNITRGEGRSIRDLAYLVKKLLPQAQIVERDVKPYRPNRGTLDISKAIKVLDYSPKYSLEEGMQKYLEFVQTFSPQRVSR